MEDGLLDQLLQARSGESPDYVIEQLVDFSNFVALHFYGFVRSNQAHDKVGQLLFVNVITLYKVTFSLDKF